MNKTRLKHVNPDGASLLVARLEDVINEFKTANTARVGSPDMYFLAAAVLYRETPIIFRRESNSA
jgi:hypothetical protein